MLLLSSRDIEQALTMDLAIPGMRRALAAISGGQTQLPLRTHLDAFDGAGTTLVMPALVSTPEGAALTVKIASVFANNPQRALPLVHAIVIALDSDTGRPAAVLDGSSLTGIRTAAASGAATDELARDDSHRLAILGAGVQARTHIQAICAVRDIRTVSVYARRPQKAADLLKEAKSWANVPDDLAIAETANDAVATADIVCTVTNSSTPVFSDAAVREGTHFNVVGSHQPQAREVPGQTVQRSRVFVDHLESALLEAGDLIQPINEGLVERSHILGEIGEVILGRHPGRLRSDDVTLFKSVGNAVEDAVATEIALNQARRFGLGEDASL